MHIYCSTCYGFIMQYSNRTTRTISEIPILLLLPHESSLEPMMLISSIVKQTYSYKSLTRVIWRRRFGRGMGSGTKPIDYCMSLVKQYDIDSYHAGLLLNREQRDVHAIIRAFNVEIALIKDQVRGNQLAGRIRFQWWKDFFSKIKIDSKIGSALSSNHPVADALAEIIVNSRIDTSWLIRSLQARERDLLVGQFESLDSLEAYCEEAHSSIIYVLLELNGISRDAYLQIASHIGVSFGLVTYLRSLPTLLSQHRGQSNFIPQDLASKHSFKWTSDKTLVDKKSLENIVFDIASQADGHLQAGIKLFGFQDSADRLLLANVLRGQVVRAKYYLDNIQKSGFFLFDAKVLPSPRTQLMFQLYLLKSKVTSSL